MLPAFTFLDSFLLGFGFAAGAFSFMALAALLTLAMLARLVRWFKRIAGL